MSAVNGLRHGGFAAVIVGVLLPWLRVAPDDRAGFESAEILVSLAGIGAPDSLRSLGVLWYVGAFAALFGWGAASLAARFRFRGAIAVTAPLVAIVAWSTFGVVVGVHDSVNGRASGPTVAVAGCILMLGALGVEWRAAPTVLGKPQEARTGSRPESS